MVALDRRRLLHVLAFPSTVHWMARHYETPFLQVVYNNRGWKAPKFSALARASRRLRQPRRRHRRQLRPAARLRRHRRGGGRRLRAHGQIGGRTGGAFARRCVPCAKSGARPCSMFGCRGCSSQGVGRPLISRRARAIGAAFPRIRSRFARLAQPERIDARPSRSDAKRKRQTETCDGADRGLVLPVALSRARRRRP